MTISARPGGGSARADDRAHAAGPAGTRPPPSSSEATGGAPSRDHRRGDQPSDRPVSDLAVNAVSIGRKFADQEAVKDLTFSVERGEIFGIVGPSGGGKTTTMRMLLGVLRPTSGELTVLGREPHRFRRRDRERLGYMPQHFVLFPELSVHENLDFAASIYGMSWFRRGSRLKTALDLVELGDVRKRPASQLSGGMQRRLQLACTLVHNPEVIFLDEPTAGIDPVLRARFWEHFRELRDRGRTLIVTTQYVTEAEYCDHVLVLKDGQYVADGSPEEIRRRAMGGEVVTVSGPDLRANATAVIQSVPGVQSVRWAGQDQIEVIVDDAGTAMPLLIEALREAGVEVEEISEQRPSFDDVFVRLMEGDRVQSDR